MYDSANYLLRLLNRVGIEMNYVLFHQNCMDGYAAAYAAWLKFKDTATYIPVNYGEPFPFVENVESLYILDFSYPRIVIMDIHTHYPKLRVLDHHKSAEEELKGLAYATFDQSKSGAVLAWEHFHLTDSTPSLYRYIQDRDLWQWKLYRSKEINTYLNFMIDFNDLTFQRFNDIFFNGDYTKMIHDGEIVLRRDQQYVERCMKNVHYRTFGLDDFPCVNSPILQSEIGAALSKEYGRGDIYYYHDATIIRHSLRSVGSFDVSEVAKIYGGGGHKNAAGFEEKIQ